MDIVGRSRRSLLASAAASAALIASERFAGAQTAPLRVLTIAGGPGALPLYARDNGFFSTAGLTVDVTTMTNGAAILAAVAGGAVEVGEGNAGSIAAGVLRGIPFTVIADGGLYDAKKPITLLCVARDSTITTARDLNGKRIALNGLKQIGQAGIQQWMDENGADWHGVGFIEMPFPPMGAALEAGRIDAAFIAEPALVLAQKISKVIAAPFDSVAPVFSYAAFTTTKDWAVKNAELARRFSAVIRRTAAWANERPHEAETLLAKYIRIRPSLAYSMTPLRYATALERSHLQPVIDVMAKYGYLPKPLDASDLIARL